MLVVGKNLDMLTTDPLKWIYFLIDVTALPLAVGRLHELHELLILDVFFRLLGLSERAYKGHTAFFSLLLPVPFSCLIFSLIAT